MGKAFDGIDSVQLAKLAIERVHERDIADRFELKDYPGFLFYDKNGNWERYTETDGSDAQARATKAVYMSKAGAVSKMTIC